MVGAPRSPLYLRQILGQHILFMFPLLSHRWLLMSDQESQSSFLPLSGVVFLMTLLGGSFFLELPFLSLRSPSSFDQGTTQDSLEDLDARLWQDPLALVYQEVSKQKKQKKADAAKASAASEQPLKQLAKQIQKHLRADQESLLLLPVHVPGGIYAEDGETRRRVRHAVIGGLAQEGYVPERSEHLGYFEFPFPKRWTHVREVQVPVPFEWFYLDTSLTTVGSSKWGANDFYTYLCKLLGSKEERAPMPKRVLVVWLAEDYFNEKPHIRVLMQHLLGFRFLKDYSTMSSASPIRLTIPSMMGLRLISDHYLYPRDQVGITLLGPTSSQTLKSFLSHDGDAALDVEPLPQDSQSIETAATFLLSKLKDYVPSYDPKKDSWAKEKLMAWFQNQSHEYTPHDLVSEMDLKLGGHASGLNAWVEAHPSYFSGLVRPAGLGIPPIRILSSYATASLNKLAPDLGEEPDPRVRRRRWSDPTVQSPRDIREQSYADRIRDEYFASYHTITARDDELAELLMHELLLRGDHLARARNTLKDLREGRLQVDKMFSQLFNLNPEEALPARENLGDRLEQAIQQTLDDVPMGPIAESTDETEEPKRNLLGGKMVLVGEWDTFYARSLMDTVKVAALNRLEMKDKEVIQVGYLRGLDGMIPGQQRSKASPQATEELTASSKESLEQPVGKSQLDYVRRLAEKLEAIDRRSPQKVRAIGILGSDLYDKQLILQALRPRFPKAFFFTTDLDARLLHPSQYKWSRNLIVASGYGLEVRPDIQAGIPPFRDNYQTATFLATRVALKDLPSQPRISEPPAIFEIGKGKAYQLNSNEYGVHPKMPKPALTHFLSGKGLILIPFLLLIILWLAVERARRWWKQTVKRTRKVSESVTGKYKALTGPRPKRREQLKLLFDSLGARMGEAARLLIKWMPWFLAWLTLFAFWILNPHPVPVFSYFLLPVAILLMAGFWLRACLHAKQTDESRSMGRAWKKAVLALVIYTLGVVILAALAIMQWITLYSLVILLFAAMLWKSMPHSKQNLREGWFVGCQLLLVIGWSMALSVAIGTGNPYPKVVIALFLCYLIAQYAVPKIWRPAMGIVILISMVLVLIAVVDHDLGEPFVWSLGISTWPSILVTWVVILMGAWFAVQGQRELTQNTQDIDAHFRFPEEDDEDENSASFIWREYTDKRYLFTSTVWTVLLWIGVTVFVFAEGYPKPCRGATSHIIDGLLFGIMGLLLVYLVMFAAEHTRATLRLIKKIAMEDHTCWHKEARADMANYLRKSDEIDLPDKHVDDYLDLKLLVERTGRVSDLIVYPFIIVFLDLVAHNTWFDSWSRPFFAYFFLGFLACVCLGCGILLRLRCEKARQRALVQLENRTREEESPTIREHMRKLHTKMESLAEGALAPWSRHPILKAIMWPLGGLSTLAMGEYLALLFP